MGLVLVFLQRVQQHRRKSKIPFHELFFVLRAVHTCQMEYKITVLRVQIQQFWIRVDVIFINREVIRQTVISGLSCLYVVQLRCQVPPHKSSRACYQYLHPLPPPFGHASTFFPCLNFITDILKAQKLFFHLLYV